MTKQSLLFIFLIHFFSVFAQNANPKQKQVEHAYETFQQEFDEEFDDDNEMISQKNVLSYRPAVTLPDWLVNFNASHSGKFLSVGISDPGLDSLDALEQATVRALALAAFSKKVNIQNVSDNYYLDNDGVKALGKFNSFTFYTTTDTLGFKLLEYDFTSNNEMLALIEVLDNTDDPFLIQADIELFQSETSGKIISRLYFEVSAQDSRGENIKTNWLLKETANSIEISSTLDGVSIKANPAKYKYLAPDTVQSRDADNAVFSFDMKYGLWNAYLNALAANMEQMEVFNSQVKFLDDKYDRQYQDLTRIVFTENISFNISGLKFRDNFLMIDLVKD
ncbi:MAG: hypothetical protein K9H16_04170 [Bacteroidales bacterium]|nr:hypothetical protein [Bacteroidales bacterium]